LEREICAIEKSYKGGYLITKKLKQVDRRKNAFYEVTPFSHEEYEHLNHFHDIFLFYF